jgi:hypothetical protein
MPHEGWLVPGGMTIVCSTKTPAKKDKNLVDGQPVSLQSLAVGKYWGNCGDLICGVNVMLR